MRDFLKDLPEKKIVAESVKSSCALGLLWAWFLCSGNVGPHIFGVETAYSATAWLANPLSVMISLLLFGSKRLSLRFSYRKQVLFGMIGCTVSTIFFLALQLFAPDNNFLFAVFLFLAGFSYAVLLHSWIRKNLVVDFFQLSISATFASIIMILLYTLLQFFPTPLVAWGAIRFSCFRAF